MIDITFQLTDEDIKQFTKYLFIGNWIITGTKDEINKKDDVFYQKMLKSIRDKTNIKEIEKDKKSNLFYFRNDVENKFLESIDEYNEDIFFEELIDRLTKRDFVETYNEDEIKKMNEIKFNKLFDVIQEKYIKEIDVNNIQRIRILEQKEDN